MKQNATQMRTIAGALILVEVFWTLFRVYNLHSPWRQNLPLHISDFSFICLVLGLLSQRILFCNLTLLIGVPVAFLAMAFPVISEIGAWRTIAIIRFYTTHSAIFLGGLYFFRLSDLSPPDFRKFHQAYLVTMGYGVALIPLNKFLSTNYFFTQYPPNSLPLPLHRLPWSVYFPSACLFFYFLFLTWWCLLSFFGKSK